MFHLYFQRNVSKVYHLIHAVTNAFQSLIDFAASVILFFTTLTMKNAYNVHNGGILGSMECRMWNTKSFLWGVLVSSTWNIVFLTFERYM